MSLGASFAQAQSPTRDVIIDALAPAETPAAPELVTSMTASSRRAVMEGRQVEASFDWNVKSGWQRTADTLSLPEPDTAGSTAKSGPPAPPPDIPNDPNAPSQDPPQVPAEVRSIFHHGRWECDFTIATKRAMAFSGGISSPSP